MKRGFALIEVIIAMAILIMLGVAFAGLLEAAFEASEARKNSEVITRELHNQLVLATSQRLLPQEKNLEPRDKSGITYTLTITQPQLFTQKHIILNGMYQVTVTAHWKAGNEAETWEISQLVYQP
jgi:prepilin-type N-terminal cleavage/methylation domain-containing protein